MVSKQKETVYDFVRFTVADIHGISRGKTVPAKVVDRFLQDGVHVFAGLTAVGPLGEDFPLSRIDELKQGNATIKPDLSTLHSAPSSSNGLYSVGEYFCESYWLHDGKPQECCPRAVARKQLQQLRDMGYKLLSAVEVEFFLFNAETHKPVFDAEVFLNHLSFAENDGFLYNLQKEAEKAGVEVEMMHAEWDPGQHEFALCPQWGIHGPDQTFIFRQLVKELAIKHEPQLEASFLCRQSPQGKGGSTGHFNHSLWQDKSAIQEKEANVLYDPSRVDNFSDVGRWWLAGLVKHAKALCALCAPTVHCYRYLFQNWTASRCNWGMDDRHATFRVKTCGPRSSYIEIRMGSSLSNPYLVLAGTVAAGIDGIKNKIEPPEASDWEADLLPRTLGEALRALEEDVVMVEALGREFVEWFVTCKRQVELQKLKSSDPTDDSDVTGWENERQLYKHI